MACVEAKRRLRRFVNDFSGGSIDIHARLIGQWLSQRLGQPFVAENRPGAGGNVGSEGPPMQRLTAIRS
jgi:tripartite-type tricarboxylate transporter receptor subunit TctC